MAVADVECVMAAAALNGECPRWNVAERRLYWVDMRAPALHRLDPATGEDQAWAMPDWIGCYAFGPAHSIVVALRTGLFLFDAEAGGLQHFASAPYDARRFCFNDGGCDPDGRFFVGSLYAPLDASTPSREGFALPLWRLSGSDWVDVTPPVRIANGLAWSPDGRTLYHADTARKTIWAMRYDPATGEADGQRVFARVEGGGDIGGPDGAAVDVDGFYVCALFGEGCLLRFDPDGKIERRISVPARYPTMPAFGGADLKTLFVTSALFPVPEAERIHHPQDGAIFALEAPAAGLPAAHFSPIGGGLA